jgi:hypothetical protein
MVRRALLFGSTYLFPIAGFPVIAWAWWRASGGSWAFVTAALGIPVVFGYLMPGIATHVLKRWRFTSGPRVGSYYVHHGFVYAAKLSFALLLVIRSLASVGSFFDVAAVVLVTGAATGFGGWFHDAHAVRAGKIEIDGGPEALLTFAPASYFAMGATYAGVTIASYRILVSDAAAIAWVFPAGLTVMCLIPTLVFLALDEPARRRLLAYGVRQ